MHLQLRRHHRFAWDKCLPDQVYISQQVAHTHRGRREICSYYYIFILDILIIHPAAAYYGVRPTVIRPWQLARVELVREDGGQSRHKHDTTDTQG